MSKEIFAILGLGLTLVAAVFGFGVRIGTLTERIEAQSKQLDAMAQKFDALTVDFNGSRLEMLRALAGHIEPAPPIRRTR
jgi:hypothetical protein